VVRVVDRARNPVSTHARLLPAERIAVESLLPGVVVRRRVVLDVKDVHLSRPPE